MYGTFIQHSGSLLWRINKPDNHRFKHRQLSFEHLCKHAPGFIHYLRGPHKILNYVNSGDTKEVWGSVTPAADGEGGERCKGDE